MARRLRATRKRDRILLTFKHGKVAKEVKTLTAKLEESYRIFMVGTEQLPSHSIPLTS